MSHARSLRVIGHTLDTANVRQFQLEADGPNYIVKNFATSETSRWVLQRGISAENHDLLLGFQQSGTAGILDFRPDIVSLLDGQASKQRHGNLYPLTHEKTCLSHLLRSVGDFLDRKGANAFQIEWSKDAIFVEFTSPGTESDFRKFTEGQLQRLSMSGRYQRGSRTSSFGGFFSRRH